MGQQADLQSVNQQLESCLQAIQQLRDTLPLDQVIAVDTALLEDVFAIQDRTPVPRFAVRA
jgi:hypothetical protein